jgi:mannose-6-phosphate isomerase-like protein (cupin superfamily)
LLFASPIIYLSAGAKRISIFPAIAQQLSNTRSLQHALRTPTQHTIGEHTMTQPNHETIINTRNVLVRVMRLGPRESSPQHFHTEITDTMIGLNGVVVVTEHAVAPSLNKETSTPQPKEKATEVAVSLAPGERHTVPPFTSHSVSNPGDEPVEYLLIQGVGKYDFILTV